MGRVGLIKADRRMLLVLLNVWPLLLGVVFIMLGNGMHFTLIGLRGDIEGFDSSELAIITSGYFAGFLAGANLTPKLIRRVGHVRVFAALGSFLSAALISFPIIPDPTGWIAIRLLVGFCMSGIYVTAESWLNDASTNKTRGKLLSAYMLAQTIGIIGAQGLLTLGDAATSVLFIGASILVSISFAPILLTVTVAPSTEVARPMPLLKLFKVSPLGTIGIFFLGSIYATQSGMTAVFGSQIGLTVDEIALLVAAIFGGAIVLQYPIGWLSDIMDRRKLIFGSALVGVLFSGLAWVFGGNTYYLMMAAFFAGGVTTPLYALFLAYTNDYLDAEDMASASGGLVLTFGVGAIVGPLVTGVAMQWLGPPAFWLSLGATFALIALYALFRMTQRSPVPVAATESYIEVLPSTSLVAVEAASAWATEQTAESEEPRETI